MHDSESDLETTADDFAAWSRASAGRIYWARISSELRTVEANIRRALGAEKVNEAQRLTGYFEGIEDMMNLRRDLVQELKDNEKGAKSE